MSRLSTRFVTLLISFFVSIIAFVLIYWHTSSLAIVSYEHDEPPELLSDWNLFQLDDEFLRLSEAMIPYDINTPLFSDYASKYRTIWIPKGTSIGFNESSDYDFPDGTIISKTFYYPKDLDSGHLLKTTSVNSAPLGELLVLSDNRLVETRLLVKKGGEWLAYPYVWNEEQSRAVLAREGKFLDLVLSESDGSHFDLTYMVPDVNQCAGCHAENHSKGKLKPIGVKTRHLNNSYRYPPGMNNQLKHWHLKGFFHDFVDTSSLPKNAVWDEPDKSSIEHRARSYLDINCGHCHNPSGAADTSGLHLNIENQSLRALGQCKPPVAAGRGSGGRSYSIVPAKAEESIILYRTNSADPAVMMPELGRSLVHEEGVSLLSLWIEQMDGTCD